jgi:hypothetical protein
MLQKISKIAIALVIIASQSAIELFNQSNILPAAAQPNAGIILFGNVRDNALDYTLDYGRANLIDRYYLTVKPQKYQINEVIVTVPETFKGEFDGDQIKVRVNGKEEVPQTAKWNQKERTIEIILKEPIPVDREAVLILSNVRNPYFGGIFQFDARVRSLTDIPILRYIGSWVIGIE